MMVLILMQNMLFNRNGSENDAAATPSGGSWVPASSPWLAAPGPRCWV
jgi:hypothetical protein